MLWALLYGNGYNNKFILINLARDSYDFFCSLVGYRLAQIFPSSIHSKNKL